MSFFTQQAENIINPMHYSSIRKKCVRILLLSFVLIVVVSSASFAQLKNYSTGGYFQLKGALINRDTGKIILWYPDTSGTWVRDTTNVRTGKFAFSGCIREPSYAHLIGSNKDGNYASFFLEFGNQTISLKENQFETVKMIGSKSQDEYEFLLSKRVLLEEQSKKLHLQIIQLSAKLKESNEASMKLKIENHIDSLVIEKERLRKQLIDTTFHFIKHHLDSYVSLTELYSLISNKSIDSVIALYNSLSVTIKKSRAGRLVWNEIQKRLQLTSGNSLYNFTGKDVKGRDFSLSAIKGKYVLIEFWASWCIPCRKAVPEIKQVYEKYHKQGFDVIAISLDINKKEWKEAINMDGTSSWVHLLRSEDMEQFKIVHEIPQSVLLNRSGKIIWSSFEKNRDGWKETLSKEIGDD